LEVTIICGIFGIINNHPKMFDYSIFSTLGVANDDRGGDSCGIFIDGYSDYGYSGMDKYFTCHFLNKKYLKSLKEVSIALGHCRKASVGIIDKSTAQPIIIEEDGKIQFVLIHNGTLFNYEFLAKKYIPNIDISNLTDSQILARILYNGNYSVLSEYVGGTAFVCIDYRTEKPTVMLFKGSSKEKQDDKEEYDERPLYYCISNGSLIFSSIASYLLALFPNDIVMSLTANTVYKYSNNTITQLQVIDRSQVTQEPVYTIKYISNSLEDFEIQEESCKNCISSNYSINLYFNKGKKLIGKNYINNKGVILNNKTFDCKELFFWDGILVKNIHCFRFIMSLYKKSKLNKKDFNIRFNNLIRYLSVNNVYPENNIWYEAVSPIDRIKFTGELQMLASITIIRFCNGCKVSTYYDGTIRESFELFNNSKDIKLDFKNIKRQCMFLMK
jgi:hypothetical protein